MLLIGSIMIVQVTYAWLSLSTAPELSGTETHVSANGSLEIALLNAETFADVSTIRSGVGTSIAATNLLDANETWGNIVDLNDDSYGLANIILHPSVLNVQEGIIQDNILSMPIFGHDGRIESLEDTAQTRICSSAGKFEDYGYGVRAIGPISTDADSLQETISKTLGYAIDLSLKTNAEKSHLLLQTDRLNRIYTDGSDTTMGEGSNMRFAVQDLGEESARQLISAIRVVFAEPIPDGYKLLAIARLDTDKMTNSDAIYQAPLYLEDDPDKTADITTLEMNQAKKVTAIVYLDGRFVENAILSATSSTSLIGTLNLQFSSDADLVPVGFQDVRTGDLPEALSEHKIASGKAGESVNWSLTNEGRLSITGTGAMYDFDVEQTAESGQISEQEKILVPWRSDALRSAIKSVTISKGVTHIGNNAFAECINLTDVSVSDGVVSIGENAFQGCTALKSVALPVSLTNIGVAAFAGCTSLESVSVSASLTSLGANSFRDCSALTVILYSGTSAQWEAVKKDEDWNTGADRCIIRCSDKDTGSKVESSNETYVPPVAPEPPTPGEDPEPADTTTWTLYENGTMVISGTGDMKDYDTPDKAPWHASRAQIKTLIIDSGVTSISKNAFADCAALQSASLPNTITSIGEKAFCNCTVLKAVTLPDSVEKVAANTFGGCTALAYVRLGNKVTSIGAGAFAGTAITNISFGNSVKKLGDGAFSGCSSLAHISLGYGIRSIGSQAFQDCTSLSSIVYNGTRFKWFFVSKGTNWDANTGDYTLAYVDDLTVVSAGTIGGVTWTLYDNSDYTDGLLCIDGIGSVTSIPWSDYASQIRTVNIGSGITGFCENAFLECVNLQSVNYAGTPEQWAGITFANAYANPISVAGTLTCGGDALTSLTFAEATDKDGNPVPDTITRISDYAFYNLHGLKKASLPSTMAEVSSTAFAKCPDLAEITVAEKNANYCNPKNDKSAVYTKNEKALLWCSPKASGAFTVPDKVERIAPSAFAGCDQITGLILPKSVTSLGARAFDGCTSLQTVTYAGTITDWMTVAIADEYATPMRYASNITLAGSSVSSLDFSDAKIFTQPVTSVPDFCFYGWDSLSAVTIPAQLTQLGTGAFSACGRLKNFIVDDANQVFEANYIVHNTGTEDEYRTYGGLLRSKTSSAIIACGGGYPLHYYYGYTRYNSETGIYEPFNNVTTISDFAFSGCDIGSSLDWSTVTSIGRNAFENCTSLYEIEGMSSLTVIGDSAFENCTSLYEIEGMSSLTVIGDSAFENCTSLYKIEGMSSLTAIGAGAFENCAGLFKIEASAEALRDIGVQAFANCGQFHLDYTGTRTQWAQVARGSGWSNGASPDVRTSGGDFGYFGDLTWELTEDGVLTVSGKFDMPDAPSPWEDWDSVTSVVLAEGVSGTICDSAFSNCGALTSVSIPSSITAIGSGAFYSCTSLPAVTIPGNVKAIEDSAFSGCTSLTSLTLENGIEQIGSSAFQHCDSLPSVSIPGSVETIGDSAFANNSALASVTLRNGLKNIGNGAFNSCYFLQSISIPSTTVSIGESAFSGCETLPAISIPARVESIGDYAFSGCIALNSLSIADGVKSIGESAFSSCEALPAVSIPASVESIGASAFSYCKALNSLTIANGVRAIDDYAFSHCTALTEITIPASVTSIGKASFGSCAALSAINVDVENAAFLSKDDTIYTKNMKTIVAVPGTSTGTFTLPDTVTAIGPGAFYGCSSLTSVPLSKGINAIGRSAFYDCSGLTGSLTIPGSVETIADYAFCGCDNLTSVTLQNGVKYIQSHAFASCSKLTTVTLPDSLKRIRQGGAFYPYDSFAYCNALADVYYGGTQVQWEKLVPKTSASMLLKATVHFNR